MRHILTICTIFIGSAIAAFGVMSQHQVDYSKPKGTPTASMVDGDIKLFQLKGIANITIEGETTKLKRGQVIRQGSIVETGELSNLVFMFSNGTTANVGPSTKLEIIQYMQDPFDKSQGTYTRLKKDPSTSMTHMMLHHGETLLTVKKLQEESILDLVSPIGSAGVRGTTYHCSYGINKLTGNPLMAVANLDGQVIIESQVEAELVMSDNSVAAGKYNPYVGPKLYEIPEKAIVLLEADPEMVPTLEDLPPLTPVSDFEDVLTQIEAQIENLQEAITSESVASVVAAGDISPSDLGTGILGTDPAAIDPSTGTLGTGTTGTGTVSSP